MRARRKVVGKVGTSSSPFKKGKKSTYKYGTKSIKPKVQQARVLMAHNLGMPYVKIAKKEKIAVDTVMKIVRLSDQDQYLREVQEQSVGIAKDVIREFAKAVMDDGWLMFKYLDRIGGFPDQKTKPLQVELSRVEEPVTVAEKKEVLVREWMAKLARVAYERSLVYESPLPDEFTPPELVEEVEKRRERK